MSDTVTVALIAAIPVLLGLVGKTASYVIDLTTDQYTRTIDALMEERDAWKERASILGRDNKDLRENIQSLRRENQRLRDTGQMSSSHR